MMNSRLPSPTTGDAPASFCVLGFGLEVHWVSLALMHVLRNEGYRVTGMIPLADDAQWSQGRWRSERVTQLQDASSFAFPASALCAGALPDPQVREGCAVDAEAVTDSFAALATWVDLVVVDALGNPDGSSAPDMGDVAQVLGLPVIIACNDSDQSLQDACRLVARLRKRPLNVVGWVQSGLRPMACAAGLSCVAAIPADDLQDPRRAVRHVDAARLLQVLLPMASESPVASANARKTGGQAF